MNQESRPMPQLLRLNEVLELTGLGRTTLYRLREDGDFPEGLKLSPKTVAWKLADIEEWINSRPSADKAAS